MQPKFVRSLFCLVATCLATSAFAANVPRELIDGNIKLCKQMKARTNPELAKNPEKLASLCTCSMETYFLKIMTDADFQEAATFVKQNARQPGDTPEITKAKHERIKKRQELTEERMKAAEAQCKSKL